MSGSYAYVADRDDGLDIIDISDPSSPTLTGNFNTSGVAVDVAVIGNYVAVVGIFGLVIIGVSDPSSPYLAGNFDTSGSAFGVAVSGNAVSGHYAYVADDADGLDIIGEFRPSTKVTSSTDDVLAASPIVIPFGGEPLAVLLMLGCGSYALKKRGRQLSNSAKNSERNS